MDRWAARAGEIPASGCECSPPAIPGIAIPAMSMPFMDITDCAEASECREWQSEPASPNEHESSHAAPNERAARSSATIEPANTRLTIISISMLRPDRFALQPGHVECVMRAWRASIGIQSPEGTANRSHRKSGGKRSDQEKKRRRGDTSFRKKLNIWELAISRG
jgi:hypothetical protein